MKIRHCILFMLILISRGSAQQPHKIPFASSGNTIELAVENASTNDVANIRVTIKDIPVWLHVSNDEVLLNQLKPSKEENAVFTFSVDKTAPVDKEQHLKFIVSVPSGETWAKEIAISIMPPERFELFQNYPNPFNPSTTFSFQSPTPTYVTLKVFSVLGEEVATLIDGFRDVGFNTIEWSADQLPSGIYFYRLQAGSFTDIKKMVLMK